MFKISKNQLLSDIRSGMDDHQLMTKYEIPLSLFQRLLQRLVAEKDVPHQDLYEKSAIYRTMADTLVPRRHRRVYVPMAVRIYHQESAQRGLIRDLSDSGLRVAGIEAQAGQTLSLSMPLKEMETIGPLRFDATCRWCERKGKHKKFVVSGFEITSMSDETRSKWRRFIDCLSLQPEGQGPILATAEEETTVAAKQRDFSGTLDAVDILDVVHFMLLSGNKVLLHVRSRYGDQGWVHLMDGNVVHARGDGSEGAEAFFACMSFPGGEFSTEPWSDPIHRTIQLPGEFLLMEAARIRDESF